MIRPTRAVSLTTTPQAMVTSSDDHQAGRWLVVVPQASGTVVWCESAADDPATKGARLTATAGAVLMSVEIGQTENVYLAVASGTLVVDVIEGSVS